MGPRLVVGCAAASLALLACAEASPRGSGTDTDLVGDTDTDDLGFDDGDEDEGEDEGHDAPPADDDDGDGDGETSAAQDDGDTSDGNASDATGAPGLTDGAEGSTGEPDCEDSEWFRDADADGYGDPTIIQYDCVQPSGFVATAGDCDDGDAAAYPDAPETCDIVDNDCNGLVDELSDDNDGTCNGCTLGARAGHFYYYCGATATWAGAQATCQTLGANLVTIGDALENSWLVGEPLPGAFGFWIGANDIGAEGTFTWIDGSPWAYSSWLSGEPNNANGNEDCVAIAGLTWNDVPCNDGSFAFICEGEPL